MSPIRVTSPYMWIFIIPQGNAASLAHLYSGSGFVLIYSSGSGPWGVSGRGCARLIWSLSVIPTPVWNQVAGSGG